MDASELLPFNVTTFLAELRRVGCTLGEPFHYFTTTTSTNDEAKQSIAASTPHGSTFFADFQTGGRGRMGKVWWAQPNAQILTTVVVRQPNLENNASITLAIGVALHRALQSVLANETSLRIKWPNDIEVRGRKLAGILTECQVNTDDSVTTVVGFGVNVWEPPLTADDPTSAIALRTLACDIGREQLLVRLLLSIEETLSVFARSGLTTFVEYLNRHDALMGATVRVDGTVGRAMGVGPDGALLLETANGSRAISSGSPERMLPLL